MDLIEVASSAQGVAFEVQVKKVCTVSHVATPVRQRLEQRAAGARSLPRLLTSANADGPEFESPVNATAARARTANERKREVADRVRSEKKEDIAGKRTSLEETLRRAEEKRRTSIAAKSTRAGKHFVDVRSKADGCQKALADAAQEHHQKLRAELEHKVAAHDARVCSRSGRAGQHNGQVAERLEHHTISVAKRAEDLRGKLESKAGRQPIRKPAFYVEPKFVKGSRSGGEAAEGHPSECNLAGVSSNGNPRSEGDCLAGDQ